MSSQSLIWAAVPHNSDGVVFQIRLVFGLQRFHVSRSVLEKAFRLERKASDARQLELFYAQLKSIVAGAHARRSIAGQDTLALVADDFADAGTAPRNAASGALAQGLM
jgi:hypothetical protein